MNRFWGLLEAWRARRERERRHTLAPERSVAYEAARDALRDVLDRDWPEHGPRRSDVLPFEEPRRTRRSGGPD